MHSLPVRLLCLYLLLPGYLHPACLAWLVTLEGDRARSSSGFDYENGPLGPFFLPGYSRVYVGMFRYNAEIKRYIVSKIND